jgi:hypothetical protein
MGWLSLFFIRQPGLQIMQVIVGVDGSCEMLLYCTLHESQTNSLIEWMQEKFIYESNRMYFRVKLLGSKFASVFFHFQLDHRSALFVHVTNFKLHPND